MRDHPFYRALWWAVNLALVASLVLLLDGLVWEYSTERYLRGFADAVIPLSASDEEKVEAILKWMNTGPARLNESTAGLLPGRNPQVTLNNSGLLRVCGTATNAFLNLTVSSGIPARRLLLLDENRVTKHVVAEVRIDGRWVVADPLFHTLFRDAQGHSLTKEQLRDPRVLQEATRAIAHYNPEYTYESTAHIRLARIPYLGVLLRKGLNSFFPEWEESLNWSLMVERSSFALTLLAALLLCFSLLIRFGLGWYGEKRLAIQRQRVRSRLNRALQALFSWPG